MRDREGQLTTYVRLSVSVRVCLCLSVCLSAHTVAPAASEDLAGGWILTWTETWWQHSEEFRWDGPTSTRLALERCDGNRSNDMEHLAHLLGSVFALQVHAAHMCRDRAIMGHFEVYLSCRTAGSRGSARGSETATFMLPSAPFHRSQRQPTTAAHISPKSPQRICILDNICVTSEDR